VMWCLGSRKRRSFGGRWKRLMSCRHAVNECAISEVGKAAGVCRSARSRSTSYASRSNGMEDAAQQGVARRGSRSPPAPSAATRAATADEGRDPLAHRDFAGINGRRRWADQDDNVDLRPISPKEVMTAR
jgi:hypothetical protein